MSDPNSTDADDAPEVDAVGVDADIVTNDHDPEPDDLPAGEEDGDDDIDVADLP